MTIANIEVSHLSDEELVQRILAGEKVFFETLMRRYSQRLYRVCRAILRNDAEPRTLRKTPTCAHTSTWINLRDEPNFQHG
jgi:hypothetical protein